jgi:hypothetical protein
MMTNLELQLRLSLIHIQLSELRREIQQSGTFEQKFWMSGKLQRAELLIVEAARDLTGRPPVLWLETEERVVTQ